MGLHFLSQKLKCKANWKVRKSLEMSMKRTISLAHKYLIYRMEFWSNLGQLLFTLHLNWMQSVKADAGFILPDWRYKWHEATKQTRLMVSARCFIEDVPLSNKDDFTSSYLVFYVEKSPSIRFVQIEGLDQLMSCYTLMDLSTPILLRQ